VDHISEAIHQAQAYLRDHPDEARYTDSAATAVIVDGLHCTVTGPDGATVDTDMPTSVGGSALASSPGWLLRAAAASCVATVIAMRAATSGRELTDLKVTIDSESDDRGILALDDSVPAGPLSARLTVSADGLDQEELRELADWAIAHCPVTDAIRRAVPIRLQVSG